MTIFLNYGFNLCSLTFNCGIFLFFRIIANHMWYLPNYYGLNISSLSFNYGN